MLINKIFGSIFVIVGGILTFSLITIPLQIKTMGKTFDNATFLVALLGGPTLIYLGLKLLNYI